MTTLGTIGEITMDSSKFYEYFDPEKVTDPIHIIGCGAIGSTLAVMLARCGCTNMHLYDEDVVASHNLANQQFYHSDLGEKKVKALSLKLTAINPHIKVVPHGFYQGSMLSGYVFLAVDNIEVRQQAVDVNKFNMKIKAMFDFRMRLEDAQTYAANWSDIKSIDNLRATMNFTNEEAAQATPVNACNMTMSVMPTVETVVAVGVANFINHINGKPLASPIIVNPFALVLVG
jgi:hypothetical protein